MQMSWASLSGEYARDTWSEKEPQAHIHATEPALGLTTPLLFLFQLILAAPAQDQELCETGIKGPSRMTTQDREPQCHMLTPCKGTVLDTSLGPS